MKPSDTPAQSPLVQEAVVTIGESSLKALPNAVVSTDAHDEHSVPRGDDGFEPDQRNGEQPEQVQPEQVQPEVDAQLVHECIPDSGLCTARALECQFDAEVELDSHQRDRCSSSLSGSVPRAWSDHPETQIATNQLPCYQPSPTDAPFVSAESPKPDVSLPLKHAMSSVEHEVHLVTGGGLVSNVPRHRILWCGYPQLLDWWGSLKEDFVFDSNALVPREIKLQYGKRALDFELGLIGPIQHNLAEVMLADGQKVFVDLSNCTFKRQNADQAKPVSWELTRSETWMLKLDIESDVAKLPRIINDSFCDFNYSPQSTIAREIWMAHNGKRFPLAHEAVSILNAAVATVDDEGEISCRLAKDLVEWADTEGMDNLMLDRVLGHLGDLGRVYQQGSMLLDAVQVLESLARDSA